MDALMQAGRVGNINGLYEAIKNNPTVLKEIEEIPFVNTPLHEAASAGQTNFATVMIDLAPSFARKLNLDCLSPLDVAVINNHHDTVKRLVTFDRELVRVKGKERLTPLHHAAASDDRIRCLIELMLACPASIRDLTIRGETALHIAMKSSSTEAFKILFEWVWRAGDGQLLRKKDAEGKSAEDHHNEQAQDLLQSAQAEIPSSLADADADIKNLYNYLWTPESFYEFLARKLLIMTDWCQRNLTMEMRNLVLVVAVLIATASFQATLSPPSGLKDHNKNSAQRIENNLFLLWNSAAFTTSVMVITIVLPLRIYTIILHLSLACMMKGYWHSLELVLSPFWASCSIIVSCVYIICIHFLKCLLWRIKVRNYKLAGLQFLPPGWKQYWLFSPNMCSDL